MNKREKTEYQTVEEMLTDLHNKTKSVYKMAEILLISSETIYKEMRKRSIPRCSKSEIGLMGSSKVLIKDLDTKNMTISEIAEYAEVNRTWVVRVLKAYNKPFKACRKDYINLLKEIDTTNLTSVQVAQLLGCTPVTALNLLKKTKKAYVVFHKKYKINHSKGCWVDRKTGEPYKGGCCGI